MVAPARILWQSTSVVIEYEKARTTLVRRRRRCASIQNHHAPSTTAVISGQQNTLAHDSQTYGSRANNAVAAVVIMDEVDDRNNGGNPIGEQDVPSLQAAKPTLSATSVSEDIPDIEGHTEHLSMSVWLKFFTSEDHPPRMDPPT